MRKAFFLRLVLLNTFKKRLRAALVIGGIAITSSAVIVLFGVSGGLHQLVDDQIKNGEAKDVVTVDQRNLQQIRLNQEKVSDITSITGVGDVESSVGLLGNVMAKDTDLSIPVYGVSKGFFSTSPFRFTAGTGEALGGNNVVVSTKVLEALGIDPTDAVRKPLRATITITKAYASKQTEDQKTSAPETFTIAGVIDKGELPVAYFPLEGVQSKGVDSVSQLKIRVTDPTRIPNVREQVEQMGFKTSSILDTVNQINKIFTVIQKTLIIFAFIMFGTTVAGTFTIISLTLMEEMRQVGFLRVSGMRNADVRVLFILQSILLTFLGALAGAFGGVVVGSLVNEVAARASANAVFTGKITVFTVPAPQIVLVMLLSLGIGWLVGIFPAKRAVMLKPLEEMKL